MNTDDLIKAMAADAKQMAWPIHKTWQIALAVAALVAAGIFFAMIGPRTDLDAAMHTVRFPFKFVLTIALAVGAFGAIRALSRPGADAGSIRWLAVVPVLLGLAVVIELVATPPGEWASRMIGTNNLLCLTLVPLIGIGPLAVCLAALRLGAPTRPRWAGAVAGLLAGSVAATFYAAHCFDDSPLFVAVWYTMAIGIVTAAGAALGPHIARW